MIQPPVLYNVCVCVCIILCVYVLSQCMCCCLSVYTEATYNIQNILLNLALCVCNDVQA